MNSYDQFSWAKSHQSLELTTVSGDYKTGIFEHRLGVVRVVQFRTGTALYLIRGGREYQRRWDRCWGPKTISRLAREFLEEFE